MQKRVFIIHGWDGRPEEGWFPWLRRELESMGFSVFVPQLPETSVPKIKNWVPALAKAVGTADENTIFVGHSMGCQAIARYLETLPGGITVGGAVFVAGFFKRLTLGSAEDDAIAREWLETPIDLERVKSHLPKSVAIFSDNDQSVPLENQNDFQNSLGSEVIVEHNMGHFSGSNNVIELPVVLKKIIAF